MPTADDDEIARLRALNAALLVALRHYLAHHAKISLVTETESGFCTCSICQEARALIARMDTR